MDSGFFIVALMLLTCITLGALIGLYATRQSLRMLRAAQATLLADSKMSEQDQEAASVNQILATKNAVLSALVKHCPLAIVALDEDQRVIIHNPAAEKMFGWKESEIIGMKNPIIPDSYREEFQWIYGSTVTGKSVSAIETTRQCKDGSLIDVRIWSAPLEDNKLVPLHAMAIFEDIRNRKTHLEELHRAKNAAEEANVAKTTFLANMSHEIRTPLTAIIGFADLMEKAATTSTDDQVKRLRHYSAVIHRNGVMLADLIKDILDVSKIEAGEMRFVARPFDIRELLTDVVRTLSYKSTERCTKIEVTIDDQVPLTVYSDAVRVRQILLNIIGNAVKFTTQGGIWVKAEFVGNGDHGLVQISVKDNGIGIRREDRDKLFEPFYQAPDQSALLSQGGTGLGLYLARRMAVSLGGDVWLTESALGKGSTFIIAVAVNLQKEMQDDGAPARPHINSMSRQGASANRVLLVEDVQDNQELISQNLQELGYQVDIADNGQNGIEAALKGDYDFILMDLRMPAMDGYEAVRKLRANQFSKKIIAVSAFGFKEEQLRCLEMGFDAYLAKPFTVNQLHDVLSDTSK